MSNESPFDPASSKTTPAVATAMPASPGWESAAMERVLMATLAEQRAARRWKTFFRIVLLGILLAVVTTVLWDMRKQSSASLGPHSAVIDLDGEISMDAVASATHLNDALRAAFDDENTRGVILRINSPGGSPVQSSLVYEEIRRLRAKNPDIPLYVVVEELCASGAYFVAAAADQIYVNPASLVGSIGVLMDGFGFTEVMKKVGVERRLITAGENKGMLDPFSPVTAGQAAHTKAMLADVHKQFIAAVKQGRGTKLAKAPPDIFSGLIYTGAKSVELGLADDFGSVESVARDVIKAEDLVDFSPRENVAERLAKRLGASFGAGAMQAMISKLVSMR